MADVVLRRGECEVFVVLLSSLEGKEFGTLAVWCVCVCVGGGMGGGGDGG